MKQISNQTLAFLLVLAVVVSLGGTYISLHRLNQLTRGAGITAFAGLNTSTGNVNLTVSDITEINFTQANVSFGTGSVHTSCSNCTIDNTGGNNSPCCIGFFRRDSPLVVENIGNNNVTLNLSFSSDADGFLGGTAAINSYKFRVYNNTARPGCYNLSNGTNYSGLTEVTTTIPFRVCSRFLFNYQEDAVNIDINLTIPQNALLGLRSTVITANGETT